ncbi:superoxide dismutase family protein [Streptomyces sp. CNQ085]|uniref:superoxide dismutase family protein n=1 Tax=Streptomyces sp. CNQ085 TaxID=2886944 RepID=UPI001F506F76|nr:superoxide dismutase family protein [Streptomyces sp. CNQ085]MCI0385119.1 superoxide dismutase family protein [Streptomyces sp. CNQ085]
MLKDRKPADRTANGTVRRTVAAAVVAAAAVVTAAAGPAGGAGAAEPVETAEVLGVVESVADIGIGGFGFGGRHRVAWAGAEFAPPGKSAVPAAVTYDRALVPVGAGVSVARYDSRRGMTVALGVRGLSQDRGYGAHVHTEPCGVRPGGSGPRYRNVPAPSGSSAGPRHANPENEVWLDFTTDEHGEGRALSSHMWRFRAGEARSVVLYEHRTAHEPGRAGDAGRPVACVTAVLAPEPGR